MKTIITTLFLITSTFIFGQTPDLSLMVSEGVALHDQGKFDKAIKKYDEVLAIDPENIEALGEKAFSLEAQTHYHQAIELCEKAINIAPEDKLLKFIYVIYANSEDKLGNSKRSLQIYDEGLEKFPNSQQLHFNKSIALIGLQEYADGLLSLQKSVSINPSHITSHNAIGRVIFPDNKIPALFALCQVAVINPESALANDNLPIIQEIIHGSAKKTGKNTITINLEPIDTTARENNFSMVESILTFNAALLTATNSKKKNKKRKRKKNDDQNSALSSLSSAQNSAQKFANSFEAICDICKETQDKNSGFYWDFYVPYYLEMKENDFVETFSYLVFYTSGEKEISKWVDENPGKIKKFYTWASNYAWN